MPALVDNLKGEQGSTLTRTIPVFESDGVTPFDFSGWELQGYMRRKDTDAKMAEFAVTSPLAGFLTYVLSAVDTANTLPDRTLYYYDIEASKAGEVFRIVQGSARFKKNATVDVSVAESTGIAAFVQDVPNDGKRYNRTNGTWVEVTAATEDAPNDGKIYVRRNGAWEELVISQ